jgi:hypothetical protein
MSNLADWYWSGTPGVYGSKRGGLVANPSTDSAYQAWRVNQTPTPWPVDASGQQDTAALDWVLENVGLPPTGLTAPTEAQLLAAAFAQVASLMTNSRTYNLGGSPAVSVKCDGTQGTGADLAGLNAWGSAAPTATTTWVDDFGTPTTITGAQGVALAAAVIVYGQSVYDKLGSVCAAIGAGSITTLAQVASAGWPT